MKALSLSLLLLLMGNASQPGDSSSGTRGGGNVAAAEFADLARAEVNALSSRPPIEVQGFAVDPARLQRTVAKVKIFASEEPLTLDGKAVNAINDRAEATITFYPEAWRKMSARERQVLVMHELLGLTFPEISDLGYAYSTAIVNLLDPEQGISLTEAISCEGAEPFWSLTIVESRARFDWDIVHLAFPRVVLSSPGVTDAESVMTLKATNGTNQLLGFISAMPGFSRENVDAGCNVGMGALYQPYQIQLFLDGTAYTGCCHTSSHPVIEGEI